LAAVTTLVWFVWLPRYRPALVAGEAYGIDVSHHQGEIDWDEVASDGISFVYIKATEGGDLVDDRSEENWVGAGEAGLARGAYHFFTLCRPGTDQADNFPDQLPPPDAVALPPAVDLELTGNCSERPARAQVLAELRAFLEIVEAETGRDTVLYLRQDFDEIYRVDESFDRPLWTFRYLRRPSRDDWTIWQVGGYAYVDGIDGRVDLNVMRQTGAAARMTT
jgi:lysozyme